jgi:AcrR family transcriptional regulator
MDDRRLTPEDVAKRAGLNVASVYKYLDGRVEQPRGDVVKRLAQAVHLSEMALRYGDGANGDLSDVAVAHGASILIDYKMKMELYESALRFIVALPSNPDDRLSTKMRMIAATALGEPDQPPATVRPAR